jgi:pseudouridine kinase
VDAQEAYIAVLGGANLDIGGHARDPLLPGDSHPGFVTVSPGGVGRNIAHNLALLGLPVRLIAALGGDANTGMIEASCAGLGIDLSASLRFPNASSSVYLYVAGPDGDMALAVADMSVYDGVTPEDLLSRVDVLSGAKTVVADANWPAETLRAALSRCTAPVFADPVSAAKAARLRGCLDRIHTLKPNRLEAELLSGVRITDETSLRRAADVLLDRGVRRVFLSLGGGGVLAAEGGERQRLSAPLGRAVSTTGCGDAFMAGLVWAWERGFDLRSSAAAGMCAGAIAMESETTINPAMDAAALEARIEAYLGSPDVSPAT